MNNQETEKPADQERIARIARRLHRKRLAEIVATQWKHVAHERLMVCRANQAWPSLARRRALRIWHRRFVPWRRRLWRQGLGANAHYKFCLLRRGLSGLQAAVTEHHERDQRALLAPGVHAHTKAVSGVRAWVQYTAMRRWLRVCAARGKLRFREASVRQALGVWSGFGASAKWRKQVIRRTDPHHLRRQARTAIWKWAQRVFTGILPRVKAMEKAVFHMNSRMKSKGFQAFLCRTIAAHHEKKRCRRADALFVGNCLSEAIETWKRSKKRKARNREHFSVKGSMCRIHRQRAPLELWIEWLQNRKHQDRIWTQARLHHNVKNAHALFRGLKRNCQLRRMCRHFHRLASVRWERSWRVRGLQAVRKQRIGSENRKCADQMRQSVIQYRRFRLQSALRKLLLSLDRTKENDRMLNKAMELHLKASLRRGMTGLGLLRVQEKAKREKESLAEVFRDSALLIRCFHAMKLLTQHNLKERKKWQLAEHTHARILLKRVYVWWMNWMNEKRKLRAFCLQVLGSRARRSFTQWIWYKNYKTQKHSSRNVGEIHFQIRYKMTCMCLFSDLVSMRRYERDQLHSLDIFRATRVAKLFFQRVRRRIEFAQYEMESLSFADSHFARHCALMALTSFHRLAVYHFKLRSALKQMLQGRQYRLLTCILQTWERYAKGRALKNQVRDARVKHFAGIIASSCLQRTFGAWVDWYSRRVIKQLKHGRALGHRVSTLMGKVFQAWHGFKKARKDERHKTFLALRFLGYTLQRRCFAALKIWADSQIKYRLDSRESLWHWKFTMEKRAWQGWLWYVQERRRKKERGERAMAWRQTQLVREACVKLLSAAEKIRERKVRLVVTYKAEHTKRVWQRVSRYARHWWNVTRARRAKRVHSVPAFVPPPTYRPNIKNYLSEDINLRPYITPRDPIQFDDQSTDLHRKGNEDRPLNEHDDIAPPTTDVDLQQVKVKRTAPRRPLELLMEEAQISLPNWVMSELNQRRLPQEKVQLPQPQLPFPYQVPGPSDEVNSNPFKHQPERILMPQQSQTTYPYHMPGGSDNVEANPYQRQPGNIQFSQSQPPQLYQVPGLPDQINPDSFKHQPEITFMPQQSQPPYPYHVPGLLENLNTNPLRHKPAVGSQINQQPQSTYQSHNHPNPPSQVTPAQFQEKSDSMQREAMNNPAQYEAEANLNPQVLNRGDAFNNNERDQCSAQAQQNLNETQNHPPQFTPNELSQAQSDKSIFRDKANSRSPEEVCQKGGKGDGQRSERQPMNQPSAEHHKAETSHGHGEGSERKDAETPLERELANISQELEEFHERRAKWQLQKKKLKSLHAEIQEIESTAGNRNNDELLDLYSEMAHTQANIQDFCDWRESNKPRIQQLILQIEILKSKQVSISNAKESF